ncbi:MAG: hypothetical protein FWG66_12235 [Spirochaetes bacterium]|nr:hypothetical protein [Spirochaetota bacterium]
MQEESTVQATPIAPGAMPDTTPFTKIWAILEKTSEEERRFRKRYRRDQEEFQKRFEQRMETLDVAIEKRRQELDEAIEKRQKELDEAIEKRQKEFNTRIGHMENLFGNISEGMLAPKLEERFLDFGLELSMLGRNMNFKKGRKVLFEVDALLENDDQVMLVEIKTKLTEERINKHIERLEKMREYLNRRGDKRVILGAVAGVIVPEEVKPDALNAGLFLIEPSGDDLKMTAPQDRPREW